jgi:hypothetical protein
MLLEEAFFECIIILIFTNYHYYSFASVISVSLPSSPFWPARHFLKATKPPPIRSNPPIMLKRMIVISFHSG